LHVINDIFLKLKVLLNPVDPILSHSYFCHPSLLDLMLTSITIMVINIWSDWYLFWPVIIHDKEDELIAAEPSLDSLEQFPIPIEGLKPLVAQKGDIFKSEELTVKTKFGE
jgi:hypothetical protein